ncbi:glycosyltransferase [Corynebacterium tuberculostearicum]|uniref:glycosyltransferase n=1 Tax=Corynebacterium marquesiae TaxID=2913503 RepID=UPI00290F0A12|nr:glycosyltransferase [Corynebacterium sp.]
MSKVIDAWNKADFEFVAGQKLSRFKRKDIRGAIRESRYALKLLERTRALEEGEKQAASEGMDDIKVVTILHASLPNHTGGYTGRAQGLLKGLMRNGINVRAYTRPGFYSERVNSKEDFPFPVDQVDGVEYRHLPADFPRKSGEFEYMFKAIDWYREVFLVERPNVVHVRSTYLIALPALIAAHELGVPVLYEVSGLWELVFEGRGQAGKAQRIERMEDTTCRFADRVVTMNSSMAKLLDDRSEHGLDIGLVPNAVDTSKFVHITPLEEKEKFKYDVGYVGSLVDYEGLETLIRAVALGKQRQKFLRVRIVGKGAELEKLRSLAGELDVSDLVDIPGPVSADEAVGVFEDTNLIVLPRLSTPATENVTPLKPFEAMAAGRPLVVSSVSALSEVSRGGKAAVVFQQGEPEELLNKISDLLGNREKQIALSKFASAVVTEEHNWDWVAATMAREIRATASPFRHLPFLTDVVQVHRRGDIVYPSVS